MQDVISFATFNACNLALPGMQCYDNLAPYSLEEYSARTAWMAQQLDALDADVIGFQEIFSQAALQEVLSKTTRYRTATLIGFDPDPALPVLTPSVALVSRLPLDRQPVAHADFPRSLSVPLPEAGPETNRFTRPVLQASVVLSPSISVQVLVLHLKSKRPDYLETDQPEDPYHHGIASLRSHIRRSAEALGLRYLLLDIKNATQMPMVVLGDFNDGALAASTQLVMGQGHCSASGPQARLYDSVQLQAPGRDPAGHYTIMHEGCGMVIDHILVSEEFHPDNPSAIGTVSEVRYFKDHLALQQPEASDHAQVLTRIRLRSD